MVRLSKRVEYALLAMQAMAVEPRKVWSATDIATRYHISKTLVAKVLQQLVHAGMVRSNRGVNGGYSLLCEPGSVSVADVLTAVEGESVALVDCQGTHNHECSSEGLCTIREPLFLLQQRIVGTLASMTIAELSRSAELVSVSIEC